MKICAMTMVHKDYWALGQWYNHYKKHIGAQNLYVISHGQDPMIAKICPHASIITIPRDDLRHFDRVRMELMNGIQAGLGSIYDWVIQTDADELVCFNPARYQSFADLFTQTTAPALFALGLNIAEVEGDPPLGPKDSALSLRNTTSVTGNYSKAWAVRKPLPLRWHGVFCGKRKVEQFPFEMPDEVFFVHLKHANLKALETSNTVRRSVAETVGEEWTVNGWANPGLHAQRFYRKLAAARELPWHEAVALGYAQVRDNPVRDARRGIVKPPFINYVCRTTLPQWFKTV